MPYNNILLYCRPGFENECASEITDITSAAGIYGFVRTREQSGYVVFCSHSPIELEAFQHQIHYNKLVFARQCLLATEIIKDLPVDDRITPLLSRIQSLDLSFCELWQETPDTNDGKQLSGFCKKFEKHLTSALNKTRLLNSNSPLRLHLFFLNSSAVYVAISHVDNSANLIMGIPRLRMPGSAPSRSTPKLDEAFNFMLSKKEQAEHLQNGMTAVDLGACPGGWTWQLVNRSIRVNAIDNGAMDSKLMETGLVKEIKADGFKYRPEKPVDWLVCDMVERPMHITRLMARWFTEGQCKHAVFNLKLPMKKRYDMVMDCKEYLQNELDELDFDYHISIKQLYHDREEVTCLILSL